MKLLSMTEFLKLTENNTSITDFKQDPINGMAGSYDSNSDTNNGNPVSKNKFDYPAFIRNFKNEDDNTICRKEQRRLRLRSKRRKNK